MIDIFCTKKITISCWGSSLPQKAKNSREWRKLKCRMIKRAILTGQLTHDPEFNAMSIIISVAMFILVVERQFTNVQTSVVFILLVVPFSAKPQRTFSTIRLKVSSWE